MEILKKSGHDVFILQIDIKDDLVSNASDVNDQGIILLGEKHFYCPLNFKFIKYRRNRFLYGRVLKKYSEKLIKIYQTVEKTWGTPDIIHAHVSLPAGYGASILSKKTGIPVIVTEHYSGFENDAKYWWRVGKFVKDMGKEISGFYAVSPGFAERVKQTGLVDVKGVLPNPIDINIFNCESPSRGDDTFNIVTTGSLSWTKGTDILLESLRQLIGKLNWRLTIFGSISNEKEYSKWLDDPDFSSRIRLPGVVSQSELVSAYAHSDLFVVSSRVETANVSMLEAMACGIPVVTTSCGAPETLIDDSVGIAVVPNRSDELAKGILDMSKNLANFTSENNRNFVITNYSYSKVSKMLDRVYCEALENQK